MDIKQLFEKYGQKKIFEKWYTIFSKDSKDSDLYYIINWEISLIAEEKIIALVGKWEIIWENSFLKKQAKPISAVTNQKVEIITINNEDFTKIQDSEKAHFLTELNLFLSQRIYLLNDIINNLLRINEKISKYNECKIEFDDIKEIFKTLINIKNIYVYKSTWEIFFPVFESKTIIDLNKEHIETDCDKFNIDENNWKIIVKTKEYLFILEGEKNSTDYIFNNSLMYCKYSLNHLWTLLENQKNESLEWLLKY